MSNEAERGTQRSVPGSESGRTDRLRSSTIPGLAGPRDDHSHSTDHYALIYETSEDQFASVIPFIRQGLDRGERCLYVADDNSKEAVLTAMQNHGIDVDTALESGALTVFTPSDTYHRTGQFDRDAMIEFWEEALEQTKAKSNHTGIRAAAEMTWALDGDTSTDELIEYEALLNELYQDDEYVVMCQYNRERFPAAVIHDVIKTHPYIVSDRTVSPNVYYTPPEEYFSTEPMETKVDRMMQSLEERTAMKTRLDERQEYLRRVFESSHDAILIIDPAADTIVDANSAAADLLGYTHEELVTFGPAEVHPDELDTFHEFVEDVFANGTGWIDELTCRTKGQDQIPVEISASRMELSGRPVVLAVVRDIRERRKWELAQRRLYEIMSDPDPTFDEKLQTVFELGCEQFDLDIGGIARVDPATDLFEVERISGDHDYLVPGEQYPLSETYCRAVTEDGETAAITNPVSQGFEGNLCYDQFGVRTYLGTYFRLDDGDDRTFFFVSNQPRDSGFSEAECTFHNMMGQWVKYELNRQQRERELRERTEHLSALVETAPECIKTVAPDGTLLQMNPAGVDIAAADSASDVIGNCIYDFIVPEDRERYREFNERICAGERGSLEFDIIGMDGTRRHMESHAAPLHRSDGETVQLALTRDVTEQVERERELERTLDLLERTERIADVGGWEIDTETMEVFWTEHLFDLLETSYDEEPPLDEALDVYLADDRPKVRTAIEEALETGDSFEVEARFRTDSGEVRWLRIQGAPETVDGTVVSLRGAAQDVTDRKQRERRLEEVVDRLAESNERLEQFAYAASHDLQEPLRMVSSYLQLIEQRYEDVLDADGEEFLAFAIDGADRMRAMIEGLLAYSRVETQGDTFQSVDLDGVLEAVLTDLQFQITEHDAHITRDELPTVEGDDGQLRQVFQNLLDNAIEYSGDEPPRVHVSADRDGTNWIISVRDEGIGIDPEDADRVFEVFQRLHSREDHPGTGIGLALCERIIERHGGDMWIDSAPGEGTTVSFTLPPSAAHE